MPPAHCWQIHRRCSGVSDTAARLGAPLLPPALWLASVVLLVVLLPSVVLPLVDVAAKLREARLAPGVPRGLARRLLRATAHLGLPTGPTAELVCPESAARLSAS